MARILIEATKENGEAVSAEVVFAQDDKFLRMIQWATDPGGNRTRRWRLGAAADKFSDWLIEMARHQRRMAINQEIEVQVQADTDPGERVEA